MTRLTEVKHIVAKELKIDILGLKTLENAGGNYLFLANGSRYSYDGEVVREVKVKQQFLKDWLNDAINNYGCFDIELEELNKTETFEEYKVFDVKITDYPNELTRLNIIIYIDESEDLYVENEDRLTLESIDEQWLWLKIVENAYMNGAK